MVAHSKTKAAMSTKLSTTARDVLLAPIYLYQGSKVKRDTVRLPEPEGERHGQVKLTDAAHQTIGDNNRILSVMVVGDSAAAGVGSQTQQEALAGKLIPALQQQALNNQAFAQQFATLSWSVQATTGHTSFDILRRLYVMPKPSQPLDVMVISVGVNDTTTKVAAAEWQQRLEAIITIAQRKFAVRQLIFVRLPQMEQMPALPAPLSHFVGAKATKLDEILQQVCSAHDSVTYMATDFARMLNEHSNGGPIDISVMFADDGFHPSSLMYGYWAQQLAELIAELFDT
ncbi:SGNH/GDSL hydrolase family protein [Psychrobacter sp. 1U2]|uniref:SGNH/GDSL hydrolase family protein n=1 Tax=Psychrobacter sp. 1U2 TaxID=3453577 RepID=UPI003F480A54